MTQSSYPKAKYTNPPDKEPPEECGECGFNEFEWEKDEKYFWLKCKNCGNYVDGPYPIEKPTTKVIEGNVVVWYDYEGWGALIGETDIEDFIKEFNGETICLIAVRFSPTKVKNNEC